MTETAFKMDWSEFDKRFAELIRNVPEKTAKEGMFRAGSELLAASKDEAPQAPYKVGDLRRAAKVEDVVVTNDKISVKVGYDIVYATRLHEGENDWKWTKTQVQSPGPKYLESKMAKNPKRFMQIVADYIRSKIGG